MEDNKQNYSSIDEYIHAFPEPVRQKLTELRNIIRELVPDAQEKISYQMPTFFLNENLVYFGAFSKHIGLYPAPSGDDDFNQELSKYKREKSSIRFPMDEPLPVELIKKIVKLRVQENDRKTKAKEEGRNG